MERIHQCATIQLDFQLPIRFNLQHSTGFKVKGEEFTRPVMVHRAMLGSIERMFAVLCELGVDLSKGKFNKTVRSVQIMQYNFQLVIGEAETTNETVNIRSRDNKIKGEVKLSDLVAKFAPMRDEFK